MRQGIGRVAELVDEDCAGRFGGDAGGLVLVIVGMSLADVGAGQHHFRAHSFQVKDFFPAHLVGDDENEPVALGGCDQREAEAGVAGGRLDDRSAGFEPPFPFGGLDHRERRPVLDRTAGIGAFELEEQAAGAGRDLGQLDHRRRADQGQESLRRLRKRGIPAVRMEGDIHGDVNSSEGTMDTWRFSRLVGANKPSESTPRPSQKALVQ